MNELLPKLKKEGKALQRESVTNDGSLSLILLTVGFTRLQGRAKPAIAIGCNKELSSGNLLDEVEFTIFIFLFPTTHAVLPAENNFTQSVGNGVLKHATDV